MKIRGVADIQCMVIYKSTVYIKFVAAKTEEMHALRNMIKELFTRMQKDDDALTVKETLGEAIWSNLEELPAMK
eukprot:4622594-Ditylum_brightwellii.AAC.1